MTPTRALHLAGPGCYLLHFYARISERHAARHYLGSAADIAGRIEEHDQGNGARIVQVARERGIAFEVARVWPTETAKASRYKEKSLKRSKNSADLCPVCQAERRERRILERRSAIVAAFELLFGRAA